MAEDRVTSFILVKPSPEGPCEYTYLSIKNGRDAIDHEGNPITPRQAAQVFLEYVRAVFEEETQYFGTVSVAEVLKFERDGTLRVRTTDEKTGAETFEILGVYAEARKKLDAFLQIKNLREELAASRDEDTPRAWDGDVADD